MEPNKSNTAINPHQEIYVFAKPQTKFLSSPSALLSMINYSLIKFVQIVILKKLKIKLWSSVDFVLFRILPTINHTAGLVRCWNTPNLMFHSKINVSVNRLFSMTVIVGLVKPTYQLAVWEIVSDKMRIIKFGAKNCTLELFIL